MIDLIPPSYLEFGRRFKSDWCNYLFYFLFVLVFGSEFEIWVFSELCILGVGERMGDLCEFLITVFILIGFWVTIDIFSIGMNVCCGFFWFDFS